MAAKMIDAGKDVTYYENIEGGHGGAANNAQAAHVGAGLQLPVGAVGR
jgi:prolyl oligopeptidase